MHVQLVIDGKPVEEADFPLEGYDEWVQRSNDNAPTERSPNRRGVDLGRRSARRTSDTRRSADRVAVGPDCNPDPSPRARLEDSMDRLRASVEWLESETGRL